MGSLLDKGLFALRFEASHQSADDVLGDFVLDDENVVQLTVVFPRPELAAIGYFDELDRNANLIAKGSDAALEHCRGLKVPAQFTDVHGMTFKLKHSGS